MRVGIVGAGITGLALTHHLAERGVDSVAVEAEDRAGGVIRSVEREGTVLEYGPQRTRMTDDVAELVDAVDLRGEVVFGDDDLPLYVYADGDLRRAPLSIGAFLRTDLLSTRGKLRLLAEPLSDPIAPEETAAEAFVRKFGKEAYENLIGPLYGGTYGSDPAAMPAEHALDGVMRIEKQYGTLLWPALKRLTPGGDPTPPPVTFAEGMAALPAALAEAHDDRVHLGTTAEAVREDTVTPAESRADGEAVDGDGYRIDTAAGTERVDEVVVTAPAAAAGDLLADVAPDLAAGLGELNYNSLAYAFLRADDDREGLGYQVRRDESLRTLGVTWNASAFDRDGLYTCFMGGMHDPEILELSAAEIGEIAAREFETVMGTSAELIGVNVVRDAIPAYDRSWDAIADHEPPEGITLATNYTARLGVPARIREAKRLAKRFAAAESGGDEQRRAAPTPS
jgi:oxygen-dependent protoporphyrinogen oxidase